MLTKKVFILNIVLPAVQFNEYIIRWFEHNIDMLTKIKIIIDDLTIIRFF